jgi:hypothetical protein
MNICMQKFILKHNISLLLVSSWWWSHPLDIQHVIDKNTLQNNEYYPFATAKLTTYQWKKLTAPCFSFPDRLRPPRPRVPPPRRRSHLPWPAASAASGCYASPSGRLRPVPRAWPSFLTRAARVPGPSSSPQASMDPSTGDQPQCAAPINKHGPPCLRRHIHPSNKAAYSLSSHSLVQIAADSIRFSPRWAPSSDRSTPRLNPLPPLLFHAVAWWLADAVDFVLECRDRRGKKVFLHIDLNMPFLCEKGAKVIMASHLVSNLANPILPTIEAWICLCGLFSWRIGWDWVTTIKRKMAEAHDVLQGTSATRCAVACVFQKVNSESHDLSLCLLSGKDIARCLFTCSASVQDRSPPDRVM